MEQEKNGQSVSRRTFLKTASAATAASAAASTWAQSSAFALAPARVIGANDRIHIGHLGTGHHATGRGLHHLRLLNNAARKQSLNIESIALCDIYDGYINEAKKTVPFSDSQIYREYRKMFENKDIDVVWIATPEHWHSIQAIEAMEAGKDVYLEKPMCRYAEEAFKVLDAQRRTKRILQVGSQGCSDPKWSKAGELISAGKIGTLLWAQGSYCRNNPGGEWNYKIEAEANPQNLDWQKFLGPAPKRAFDPERFFRWRKYWDYSSGIISDLFPHRFHPLMKATGLAWPVRVTSNGGQYNPRSKKDRDVADTILVTADFQREDGTKFTVMLAGSTENEYGLEDVIRGQKGNILMGGNKLELRPERQFADEIDPQTINIGGERDEPHQDNFLSCVRSRQTPNCDAELATRVQLTISMGEMAYRHSKTQLFDPKTRKVTEA